MKCSRRLLEITVWKVTFGQQIMNSLAVVDWYAKSRLCTLRDDCLRSVCSFNIFFILSRTISKSNQRFFIWSLKDQLKNNNTVEFGKKNWHILLPTNNPTLHQNITYSPTRRKSKHGNIFLTRTHPTDHDYLHWVSWMEEKNTPDSTPEEIQDQTQKILPGRQKGNWRYFWYWPAICAWVQYQPFCWSVVFPLY